MGKKNEKIITLEEVMKKADKEETFFIGSGSGYIFIGTVDTYKEDFDEINKMCLKELELSKKRINNIINKVNEKIAKENEDLDGVKISSITSSLTLATKELYKREVIDTYKKMCSDDPGTAVIFRGSEHGPFWFKKEYDNRPKKKN